MKKLISCSFTLFLFFLFTFLSFSIHAQPNGLCNNIQKCNDEDFSATENDDNYAGEFYNSLGTNATSVVQSVYTGNIPANYDWQMRAYTGISQPGDWYGVGARFLADFCAIEAFGTSDGSTDFGADYYGIRSSADGGGDLSVNFGILSTASGSSALASSFAVYAASNPNDPGLAYAGYFDGDVEVVGTFTSPSDAKLKKGAKELKNSLSLIGQLKPKSYQYRTDEFNFMNLPEGKQFGFIAQELEEVLPQLIKQNVLPASSTRFDSYVDHGRVDYKAVNYLGLIPIMVDAMNEQTEIIAAKDEEIKMLESELDDLLKRIENIESALKIEKTTDLNGAYLKQNQPNPANGQTLVEYYLPDHVQQAFVKVYDVSGKEIQSYRLAERGVNHLDMDLSQWGSGTFMYTLFVDGLSVETKKMAIH